MTPEHFLYIADKFNLAQYVNAPSAVYGARWIRNVGLTTPDGWEIRMHHDFGDEPMYVIYNLPHSHNVFINIPSEALAKDILQCIKDSMSKENRILLERVIDRLWGIKLLMI